MISKKSLGLEWIIETSKANQKVDKILVEKVIRAMLLLEGLAKEKLDFVFKGGTSLMLLMEEPKRLSIDIDIILEKKPKNFFERLENIAAAQGFARVEILERNTKANIPKAHFKFFYQPVYRTHSAEEMILLDVLYEKYSYKSLLELPVSSAFTLSVGPSGNVKVPSIEDILGDKLTAFAPNTTGIPYFKGEKSMSMEIIKQLYDVGNLFDVAEDVNTVKSTFNSFSETELGYRKREDISSNEVLDDIFQTALCIVSRGVAGVGNFNQLQDGIKRVSHFIFSESFHLEKAISFASKVAYLAMVLKQNGQEFEKFSSPIEVRDWLISEPLWPRQNRLKKSNPEAFYYWYRISELKK